MSIAPYLCLVILCGFVRYVQSNCDTPRPGYCNTNNSNTDNDRTVHELSILRCLFNNNLCQYRQGCHDPGMTSWTAGHGYVQADQKTVSCGANAYSILESRWVNFARPSVVQFSFRRYNPQNLKVFLALYNNSPTQTLLTGGNNKVRDGEIQTVSFTIPVLIGKLLFRMHGGGGGASNSLKLYNVTVQQGSTKPPATNGSDSGLSGGADGGAIAGAVIAVIVVIAIVVVVVVLYRRRRKERRQPCGQKKVVTVTNRGEVRQTGSGKPAPSISQPQLCSTTVDPSVLPTDSEYMDIDDVSLQPAITANADDANPYFETEEVMGEQRPATGGDEYHHIGANHSVHLRPVSDDYNHIGADKPANHSLDQRPVSDDYNHIGASDPANEIQQKAKKTTGTTSSGDGAHKQQGKGGYNTLHQGVGEETPHNYKKIPSPCAFNIAMPGDNESVPSDYNTLSTAPGKGQPSGQAYDHVKADSEGTYSKAQMWKRDVVVGSDYDHVNC